jgi:HEAT repeat protein
MAEITSPFSNALKALVDTQNPFSPKYLHHFSDLLPENIQELKLNWDHITLSRKLALFSDLQEILDADTLVNFDDVACMGLDDDEPEVRLSALRLLDYCEDTKMVAKYISMMEKDLDEKVRSEAAFALGDFIYRGELDEIPATLYNQIMDSLMATLNGKDSALVRRHALESASYSYRDEIPPMIEKAFKSTEKPWILTALLSMGRSADARWEDAIVSMITSPDTEIKVEAIQAAGELELASTRKTLLDLLIDPDTDPDVQASAIWALSKIGGDSIRSTLESLLSNTEDDEEVEFIEKALDNLSLSDGLGISEMLDMGVQEEDDLDSFIDVESDSEDDDLDES